MADLGDKGRPRWYPSYRVNEGGPGTLYRNVTVILDPQRTVALAGVRCTFEDSDGRVSVMTRETPGGLHLGEPVYITYPQDFPIQKQLVLSPGICRVLWEEDNEARDDLCWFAFEIGGWTPIPNS